MFIIGEVMGLIGCEVEGVDSFLGMSDFNVVVLGLIIKDGLGCVELGVFYGYV